MGIDIESPANERVKRLVRLRNRRHRDLERLFIVEELRILQRALAAGCEPKEVYWSPGTDADSLIEEMSPVTLGPQAMEKVSYRSDQSGFVALFNHLDTSLDELDLADVPLILVAEGIEKPGNLGAMLRVADGAGVDAVVFADPTADPFNPNAVRASTGAIFSVPIAVASVEETAGWLEGSQIEGVAAVPEVDSVLWNEDLSGPIAIWVGSEADGLSDRALDKVPNRVSIPMRGDSDSLNASVSAAVLVYEAARQRAQSADR